MPPAEMSSSPRRKAASACTGTARCFSPVFMQCLRVLASWAMRVASTSHPGQQLTYGWRRREPEAGGPGADSHDPGAAAPGACRMRICASRSSRKSSIGLPDMRLDDMGYRQCIRSGFRRARITPSVWRCSRMRPASCLPGPAHQRADPPPQPAGAPRCAPRETAGSQQSPQLRSHRD